MTPAPRTLPASPLAAPGTRRLGLVVNPVAGIGGPAGLKGSDGADVQAQAVARGATPRATARAVAALRTVVRIFPGVEVFTAGGVLGADAAAQAGLPGRVVATGPVHGTAADTVRAARELSAAGVDLLLFAGGDGTARDIHDAVGEGIAVLGIPAGVKMYSACFAVSPVVAGTLAADWLAGRVDSASSADVLDIDEEAIRTGQAEPRLYGTVRIPRVQGRTQARKTAAPASAAAAVRRAAAGASILLRPGTRYLLGPGGTMRALAELIGVPKTPLGFDVVEDGHVLHADADESALLAAAAGGPCQAVVTVIGGQGFILGRGNQQLSARVLRALGKDALMVVATDDKLTELGGRPLLVDSGDPALDHALSGYTRVVTGPGTSTLYPVRAPEHHSIDTDGT
ncbi:ATP-NAD kinase family protein [Phytoactinopolyspora limicola]|uniref:ATP-NAD kinase family protein n=1 Tax=Phytoactinopolyspora limicola TaxID=2715536 RepID=UPI001A9CB09E|nr:ATP-NAD kinase family protein [Phytoactinopolyspora limicola]